MRKSLLCLFMLSLLTLSACVEPVAVESPADSSETDQTGETATDLLAEIKERGFVRVATDANYAPQSFLDEGGTLVGFDVDVANEIAARLGVEVELVTPDWDLITAGNWGDQWDMSVGSMAVTRARQEVLDFAEPPYYYGPAQFAATTDSGIETLADINGQTVCAGLATTYENWLNGEDLGLPASNMYAEPPTDVEIIPLQSDNDCVQSIQAGRTEFAVFLTSQTVVEAAIAEGIDIKKVGPPVYAETPSVAFDKASSLDSTTLVEAVGAAIAEMHADGTLSERSRQWFEEDLTQNPTQ